MREEEKEGEEQQEEDPSLILLQEYTVEDFRFPLSALFILLKFSNRPVESYLAALKPNTRDFRIIA